MFKKNIWSCVRQGRSFWINVFISTQKWLTSIIGSSIKDNLDIILFRSEWTSEYVAIRWNKTKYDVTKFKQWEAIFLDEWSSSYKKFKAFYISDKKLDEIYDKYWKKEINEDDIVKEYYNYALDLSEISFSKAKSYGLNDPQYRKLIQDKIWNWELDKLPWNKLIFTSKARKYE